MGQAVNDEEQAEDTRSEARILGNQAGKWCYVRTGGGSVGWQAYVEKEGKDNLGWPEKRMTDGISSEQDGKEILVICCF